MPVHSHALTIVQKLVSHGYTAYFAGGWVRDLIMGNPHPTDDIDIATSASPKVILDLFPRTTLVGLQFGVVVVQIESHLYEVATFRKDIGYANGRAPEKIEQSSPKEDAIRRDFTINGMFYDPIEEKIHDFVGGVEDIQKRVIRTIGDPYERFFEDRLRMVRACRFAARFEFAIELETQEAIRQNAPLLFPAVAMERVWQEFCKMNAYPHFDRALIEMHRLGLLPVIFPELSFVHLKDIEKQLAPLKQYPKDVSPAFFLQELFPSYSAEDFLQLGKYLKAPNRDIELVCFYVQHRPFNLNLSRHASVLFYANPYADLCLKIYAARLDPDEAASFAWAHQEKKKKLEGHVVSLRNKTPVVTSHALMELGVKPGKYMGRLLKEAEKLAIEHDLKEAAPVIALLKQTSLWKHGDAH